MDPFHAVTLQKYFMHIRVKGLFLSLLFSYYKLMTFMMMPSVILLFKLMILLSIVSVTR